MEEWAFFQFPILALIIINIISPFTIIIQLFAFIIGMRILLTLIRNYFCINKSYFWASQSIINTLMEFKNERQSLGQQIFKAIDENQKIEDTVKVQIKKMFDPQHGFDLPQYINKQQRFSLALNLDGKYAMNPNAIMLSSAAKLIFQQQSETKKYIFRYGQCKLISGTIGGSKSCSFYNLSKIYNKRLAYLLQNQNPPVSIFKNSAKILFLISNQTKQNQFQYILRSVREDFSKEALDQLETKYKDYKQNIKKRSDEQNFNKQKGIINRVVNLYGKKNIKVILIIDQFNHLYSTKVNAQRKQQRDQLSFLKNLRQKVGRPAFLISSKNISQLTEWKWKNNISLDPIRQIFYSEQNVGMLNIDNQSLIQSKLMACIHQIAFQIKKYHDSKFVDQVVYNLKDNMPFSTHLNIAYAIREINKQMISPAEFAISCRQKIYEDLHIKIKNNIKQNIELAQIFVLFDAVSQQQQITLLYKTSHNKCLQINYNILYVDLSLFSIENKRKIKKVALINYFYGEQDIIYTILNRGQIADLVQYIDKDNPKKVVQIQQTYELKDIRQGQRFKKQLKQVIRWYIEEKKTQKLYFIIQTKQNTLIKLTLQIAQSGGLQIKYYKLPNMNINRKNKKKLNKNPDTNKYQNWEQKRRANTIKLLGKSKLNNNNNNNSQYTWDELIGTFERQCNFLDASSNNQAYDFILSFNKHGKLDIFFIDLTDSKQSNSYAINKYKNNKIAMIKNPNFYTLLQSINQQTKAQKIDIYFYVLFKQGCAFESKVYSWKQLIDQHTDPQDNFWTRMSKLQKINTQFYCVKGSFQLQFMVRKGNNLVTKADLHKYQKQVRKSV